MSSSEDFDMPPSPREKIVFQRRGSSARSVWDEVDSPEPASPVQRAEAPLTPTQQVIRAVLHVDVEKGVGEAVETLMKLEARPLSASIEAAELDPKTNPRAACYDAADSPSSWTSLDVCARCRALNQVLQVSAKEGSGAMSSGIIGLALLTTSCSSEKQRSGKTPALPFELICFVIQYCVNDTRSSNDGSTLCALMHVSSSIRLKVIEAFEPIRLYECEAIAYRNREEYHLPRELVTYVWDAVQYWLLDPTIQRHKVKPPRQDTCLDIITTARGSTCEWIKGEISVMPDSPIASIQGLFSRARRPESTTIGGDGHDRSVRGACTAIGRAIAKLGAVPRFASPFANISNGRLKASTGATIQVTLSLQDPEDERESVFRKDWVFDTLKVRDRAWSLSSSP